MKRIIFISLCVLLFYTIKTNAQSKHCGVPYAGFILQPVTDPIDYVEGLLWWDNNLLYVNRYDPQVCKMNDKGNTTCIKLEGLQEIISVYPIVDDKDKLVVIADGKVILLTPKTPDSYSMQTVTTVNSNPATVLRQSATDSAGRIIIGANSDSAAKVYIVDNYAAKELIPEKVLDQVSGVAVSRDNKFLYLADSKKNLIYKYEYDNTKGTVGKSEVIYDKSQYMPVRGDIATMAIDVSEEFWISFTDSGMVALFSVSKKQYLRSFKLPAPTGTSIAYGGSRLDFVFTGTAKRNTTFAFGAGSIYAASGTFSNGYKYTPLPMPKVAAGKSVEFINDNVYSNADTEKMAVMDGSYII